MSRQVLALDFDGVICHSATECLITANAVYRQARGEPAVHDLAAIPAALQARFFALRPFIRDGQDYVLILHFIERDLAIDDQPSFDAAADAVEAEVLDRYGLDVLSELEDLFQATRRRHRARDSGAWLALNQLYTGMHDALSAQRARYDCIFITTSKPSEPARDILRYHGLTLPESHILGQDKVGESKHKNRHLARVHEIAQVAYDGIHFVEDQVSHLEAARSLNVQTYLAGWGYNTVAQQARAVAAGATVLQDGEVAGWMAGILQSSPR